MLRPAFFGDYDLADQRVAVIMKGLRRLEVPVIDINARGFLRTLSLAKRLLNAKGEYDVVVVPDGRTWWMPIYAAMLTESPVVWLPAVSHYDIAVNDSSTPSRGIASFFLWLREWALVSASDLIVVSSRATADFFARVFGAAPQKFGWAFPGADDDLYRTAPPRTEGENVFEVEYHGDFLTTDGIDCLIRAAKILEDDPAFRFTIVGDGKEAKRVRELITELEAGNVIHLPYRAFDEPWRRIIEADALVGVLGATEYAKRALPTRIFEAAAAGKPSVTVFTPAFDEAFDMGHIVAVKPNDPEDLAAKLRDLKSDISKRKAVTSAAYQRYSAVGTPESVARRLVEAIEGIRT